MFAPFGQSVSEEKIVLAVANQKQELSLAAIFVHGTKWSNLIEQGDSGEEVALWLLTSLCTSVKREVEVTL